MQKDLRVFHNAVTPNNYTETVQNNIRVPNIGILISTDIATFFILKLCSITTIYTSSCYRNNGAKLITEITQPVIRCGSLWLKVSGAVPQSLQS